MKLFNLNFKKESYSGLMSDAVPGQSLDLNDLVKRFVNGQRLLVNQRPPNLYDCDDEGSFTNPSIIDEDESNVLPDIEDPVDLEEYIEEEKQKRKNKMKEVPKEEPKEEPEDESKEE